MSCTCRWRAAACAASWSRRAGRRATRGSSRSSSGWARSRASHPSCSSCASGSPRTTARRRRARWPSRCRRACALRATRGSLRPASRRRASAAGRFCSSSRTARCRSRSWSSAPARRPPPCAVWPQDGLVTLTARLRVPTVRAGRTPPPESLTAEQTAAVAQVEALLEAGGGDVLLYGVTGFGQDRGLSARRRERAGARAHACSCSCPRSRSRRRPRAASPPASAISWPCCIPASRTASGERCGRRRSRATCASSSARARRSSRRCPASVSSSSTRSTNRPTSRVTTRVTTPAASRPSARASRARCS